MKEELKEVKRFTYKNQARTAVVILKILILDGENPSEFLLSRLMFTVGPHDRVQNIPKQPNIP